MHIISKLFFTCGLIVLFSLKGFSQKKYIDIKEADSSTGQLILAEAGNKKITVKEFLYGYEFGPAFPKKVKNSKEVYLNYLINEKLLAGEGYTNKIDTTSVVKDRLYCLESDLSTEELFKDQVLKQIKIPAEDINEAIRKKLISVELKWLFAPTKDSLQYFSNKLADGVKFDSLFSNQLKDSVFADQREWNTDLFEMEQKSSMIANLIKNQKANSISSPLKGPDGWYVFKLVNIWNEVLPNESELIKLREDSQRALTKTRMDSLSDQYVNKILINLNPEIDGKTFYLLRLYLARHVVSPEKFNEWNLETKLNSAVKSLDSLNQDFYSLVLVNMKEGNYTINDFIFWLKNREQLVKFNDTDFNGFSSNVESLVWRMVRDNSLTKIAFDKGYQNKPEIKQELSWWKDKIVYEIVRNNLINTSVVDNSKESFKFEPKPLSDEANKKLLHKVLALKQKNKITINRELLNEIKVEDENDPRTVEIYAVKKGGIFPHPAFPSIDLLWQNWQ